MLEFRKTLPQLDPLIAFEAAARRGSFARAAEELNVTASAVSQQIRSLETQLSVELFERRHRSVKLTMRGEKFYNSVSMALVHLQSAARDARLSDGLQEILVMADTSIAAHWLVPRMKRFKEMHPNIALSIKATDDPLELLQDNTQIALLQGDGKWRGYDAHLLFEEEIFPVCAPSYVGKLGNPVEPENLSGADLLDLDYENWQWMNWTIWLTEMRLPQPQKPRALRMNSYPLLIEAAKRGAGVALGWKHLVDEDLSTGHLIKPVDASIKTSYGYYIATPHNQALTPASVAFLSWLQNELE